MSSSSREIPLKQWMRNFAPECFPKTGDDGKQIKPAFHAFPGLVSKHDMYVNMGYEPVLDKNKRHVKHEGGELALYKLDMRLHERDMKDSVAQSKVMLQERKKKDGTQVKSPSGGAVVTQEEYEEKLISGKLTKIGSDMESDA
ncbi:MAG: hypothetical protein WC476_11870 [Phycisphaerae bacterium]